MNSRHGGERYFGSEEHGQAVNKANPQPSLISYFSIDFGFGYGTCAKNGG